MCTVVVRWAPDAAVRVLALRDELADRPFDDPDEWWPERPGVVGGRDRSAGGTWCAVDVASGVAALVLNRPQKRQADPGAPSRGVLPLLAATHGVDWTERLDPAGMASFLLVLAGPEGLRTWAFDGRELTTNEHPAGTTMVTSGFEEDGKVDRYLSAFQATEFPDGWRDVVASQEPAPDPAALVVRHEHEGRVFATVFGQLFEATPGRLDLSYSRRPWVAEPWSARRWPA